MNMPRVALALVTVVGVALLYASSAGARAARVRTGVGEGGPGDSVHSSRTDPLAADELVLTLEPGHGERFLKVVDQVMGTETVKSLGHERFLVRRGPGGSRDDFAAFFGAMPYVKEVKPRPKRQTGEQVPGGKVFVAPPGPAGEPPFSAPVAPAGGRDYVPGEILVKFKRGTPAKDIDKFVLENGTRVLSRLDLGEDRIYKLQVPEGVDVPDLASVFSTSPIVEYAEPNFRMGIPPLPGAPGKPATPSGPKLPAVPGAIAVSPDDLLGDSIFVTFRPGVRDPIPDLLATVFGVKVQEEDGGRVRYSLPGGVNPLTAVRLFKLCPYVMGAEPSYGR